MATSHLCTKKAHTKRKKHRHSIVKSNSPSSMKGLSYLKYKLFKSTAIGKRFTAVALCFFILLSLLSPVIFSVTQSLQSKHSNNAIIKPSTSLSTKDIWVSSFRSFQNTISFAEIKVSINNALKELAHLKRIEMGIPDVVYLHSRTSRFPTISAFPEVVEERLSDEDIAVDLSHAFDSNIAYDCSAELEEVFCRVVCREAGNQPFLGQLIVAEGVVSRVYSGAYRGNSTNAILKQGYEAEEDSNGKLHIYDGEGKEILSYSEDTQKAVELALRGSRVSHTILKAVTEFQNAKYGLQLDDTTYSQWGAIYHYAPKYIRFEHQFSDRNVRRAPVSFQFVDHVFYGYWLPASLQLNL